MKEKFQVQLSDEVQTFLRLLDEEDREKILCNIHKAQITNDNELFKNLTDEIWEFRTLFKPNALPIFCFLG